MTHSLIAKVLHQNNGTITPKIANQYGINRMTLSRWLPLATWIAWAVASMLIRRFLMMKCTIYSYGSSVVFMHGKQHCFSMESLIGRRLSTK